MTPAAGTHTGTEAGTATPWLTSEQVEDWKSLIALVMTLPAALDAQLRRDAGMNTFEYQVLVSLEASERGMLPMTDLAVMTQSSPSRLSHGVSRLERAGWVERVECHEAGRRTSAHLTDAGLAKLRETAPGHVREARRLVVDALGDGQLAALGEAARVIVSRTSPEMAAALGVQPRASAR
ncbi:MarR family winged helix-turn-helix transcriptional regulator [Cellulomonas sp. PhB143]|uniref:MarR family winged helix-turn-helix transcriptional regulator n=1 Tax=Cellulomonas sp. PhB143 TaxID=2485186 RepID=UPI000F49CF46|nr:MarR family transcriptional regulator [Cellulomonas sp. PhB143]ROS75461.1 YD repeat-containing protein [Cellulomonas sp. PhB143]